ncbi:MAG: class I SAM-dependent methyltransferase, partial [Nitrososphaerota archaeon]
MVCFEKYSEIYNLIYSDKDYNKETDYIVKKLQQYNCKSKELLEYGSGTGVHGSLLVQKGYKVTGIEISKNMYQIAKSRIDELGINNKFNLINDNIVTYRDNKKY